MEEHLPPLHAKPSPLIIARLKLLARLIRPLPPLQNAQPC